ncbi:MAG: amidohydrolase family protein [Bdellovibrionales bacterium]|nr:amidohydrolase family protein [Bdellovibrionales bacterium]
MDGKLQGSSELHPGRIVEIVTFDFHVHIFRLPRFAENLQELRKQSRLALRPVSWGFHRLQTLMRILPDPIRKTVDEVGALAPIPMLMIESTARDLTEAMQENQVDHCLVIATPPLVSNEYVLEVCSRNPKLIAAVNIPPGTPKPAQLLRKYVEKGARALKIHSAMDGGPIGAPRYLALLKAADELKLPVVLHTGCIQNHVLYKSPEAGLVENFEPWFQKFPNLKFILAHMNYHQPDRAMDMAERYSNVYVDTSWQPSEVIGEAVRRLGAERVLFATDWPFAGNNFSVGINRVQACIEAGTLDQHQAAMILGKNAMRILGLPHGD